METYRHATYRYSTGQGFNVNVDVPQKAEQVASYKMEPLYHKLGRPSFTVEIKREADRVSMQVEAAMQQMKHLGYDSTAGKRHRQLKARLDIIKHLMTSYPIQYIKQSDLEKIYEMYEKKVPGLDKLVKEIVEQNKGATGVQDFVGTTMKFRKGYPLYDQFGRKLTTPEKKVFKKDEAKALSGFDGEETNSILKFAAVMLIAGILLKWAS